ncbi:MAG: hypothetical protein K9N09_02155 [Candidatus Cloacimonetes bacterium]|nr:hypothetical protein [Candidatus Cloacimonadota bacterium]MCF7813398.1 hypothetical protein [Candidatus Cloacimonadota bacterium]MCF7867477.1 hypothetical protein [Candidatus Cloacimonadota bacterium]
MRRKKEEKVIRHIEDSSNFTFEISREHSFSFTSRNCNEILPTCAGEVLRSRKHNVNTPRD